MTQAAGVCSAWMPIIPGSPASHSTAPSPSHLLGTMPTGLIATSAMTQTPALANAAA